jgi:hypothetical protein
MKWYSTVNVQPADQQIVWIRIDPFGDPVQATWNAGPTAFVLLNTSLFSVGAGDANYNGILTPSAAVNGFPAWTLPSGNFLFYAAASSLVSTGAGDPNYNGALTLAGTTNGYPYYSFPSGTFLYYSAVDGGYLMSPDITITGGASNYSVASPGTNPVQAYQANSGTAPGPTVTGNPAGYVMASTTTDDATTAAYIVGAPPGPSGGYNPGTDTAPGPTVESATLIAPWYVVDRWSPG